MHDFHAIWRRKYQYLWKTLFIVLVTTIIPVQCMV